MGKTKILTQEQIKQLISDYESGKSLNKLKGEYHISDVSIKKYLTENGVKIRSHRESRFKYPFNEYYFDNIDTEEKAYWLGFLYADGFIVKNHSKKRGHDILGVTLAESEPIEKLTKALNCKKPVYQYTNNGYTENALKYRGIFPSDHMVQQLEKWGVVERKTFELKFPDFLDQELIPHFIRGYFDGDGSVFYHKQKHEDKEYINLGITICGTESFLKSFAKACNIEEHVIYKDFRKETDCWSIKLASNIQCLEMYHFMYKNAKDSLLTRKKEKFDNFIKERGSTTLMDSLNRKRNSEYLKLCYLED